ncbi:MAG: hypothetical protein E4G99_07805 [Anaerolineales bacterium]|nr:MAG: hypothetical protein E4G99_07805 [Anaerolineales bacterium]
MDEKNQFGYRSFFWPIVFIGIGVIMLLANLDILPTPSLRLLFRLWPLALVVLGLDILVGRRSPVIGALIGLVTVGLVVGLLYLAPTLNLEPTIERKTLNFNEPFDHATAARVTLDLDRYATTIEPLVGSDDLFDAVLETFSDVDFSARGDSQRTIDLVPVDRGPFNQDWTLGSSNDMTWEIGLSPAVPLDLSVDVGSGSARLDLLGLTLSELRVDGGSGSTELAIPAASSTYPVEVNGGSGHFDIDIEQGAEIQGSLNAGSGSMNIRIGSGTEMTLAIEGGSGSIEVSLPLDAGVRLVIADQGSGGVRVPGDFDLTDDFGDDDRDTGIWESANYAGAANSIEIRLDPGSGTFTVR